MAAANLLSIRQPGQLFRRNGFSAMQMTVASLVADESSERKRSSFSYRPAGGLE